MPPAYHSSTWRVSGSSCCQLRLGRAAEADDAAEAVRVQRRRAKELGQPPGGDAPCLLHLPHAVLCMQPTLGTPEVGLALRIDMGHAVLVAQDFDRLFEPRHVQLAFKLWRGPLQPPPVHVHEQRSGHQRKQKKDGNEYNRERAEHGRVSPLCFVLACAYDTWYLLYTMVDSTNSQRSEIALYVTNERRRR